MRKSKKTYTTPNLIVHGTVEKITRPEDPEEPIPPGKELGPGDVQNTQWLYSRS